MHDSVLKETLEAIRSSESSSQQGINTPANATSQQLITARKGSAQRELLQDALRALTTSRAHDLPPELLESCHIVLAHLCGGLSAEDLILLADDIDFFASNIPTIAEALSHHLISTGETITSLASAGGTTSVSDLVPQATALKDAISNQSTSIALTRTQITNLTTSLKATYSHLLESSIRTLEQTLHGSLARGLRSRAEHLSSVAKGLELKLGVMALSDPVLTEPGMLGELEGYKSRLEVRADELSERVADSERTLGEYGRAGKGMLEIAKRFVEVKAECEAVRAEIETLEKRRSDVD